MCLVEKEKSVLLSVLLEKLDQEVTLFQPPDSGLSAGTDGRYRSLQLCDQIISLDERITAYQQRNEVFPVEGPNPDVLRNLLDDIAECFFSKIH